ncbi:MAG: hypothetical protein ACRDBG_04060 [Waterburya sp.]
MNDPQQIIQLAEYGSFDHLFKSGTLELPKNPRSQEAGALYDFINFKNGFYMPVYRTFEAFKDFLIFDIPVATGEVALRLVRYKTREPFYPHIDVSYKSLAIAAANNTDDIIPLDSVIYGRQAKELSNKHPKFHHFNQNGMKYYLGIFASARGDLKLSCGLTIDEYMQQQYYYSNTF